MAERLKLGAVGCGGLPSGVLFPALALVNELDLVAVCDLNIDRANAAAQRWGAQSAYADYLEMYDKEDLDCVMVAAPPFVHHEAGIAAMERGLHLFTEKPPALNADDAKRFRDAARESGMKVLMGTVQRHCPANRMAKEIMSRESFGAPIVYEAHYICPGPGMRMDWGMKRDSDADMFRFFLLDHIIHHLDLTRFFMGEIEAVSVMRSRIAGEQYAAAINYRFASGAAGSQTIAMRSPDYHNRVLIVGDGPAWVETENWTKLRYSGGDIPLGRGGYADSRIVHWDGGITYSDGVVRPGYREELTAWARAVLTDGECGANLEDGYREMQLIDAIVESSETGREVAPPLD